MSDVTAQAFREAAAREQVSAKIHAAEATADEFREAAYRITMSEDTKRLLLAAAVQCEEYQALLVDRNLVLAQMSALTAELETVRAWFRLQPLQVFHPTPERTVP